MAHHVGSLRRNDTSGVGVKPTCHGRRSIDAIDPKRPSARGSKAAWSALVVMGEGAVRPAAHPHTFPRGQRQ